jgi:membrane associated rhomboid family serine protease
MSWLNKLERKYGKFAIKNLIMYIVGLNAFVFLLGAISPSGLYSVEQKLALIPSLVMQGQVWRLITFIFIPFSYSPIWLIFALYFYYLIGTTLERQWGSFKFNVYYLLGISGTIIAAFITGGATNEYLNLSLFLAFAYLFPNFEVRLYFILPLKIKYLAYFTWAIFGFDLLTAPVWKKVAIVAAVVNFFIFFGKDIYKDFKIKRKVRANRKRFRNQSNKFR